MSAELLSLSKIQGGRGVGLRNQTNLTQSGTPISLGKSPGAGTGCTVTLATNGDAAYDDAVISFFVEQFGRLALFSTITIDPALNAANLTLVYSAAGFAADYWNVSIQLAGGLPAASLFSSISATGVEDLSGTGGGGGGVTGVTGTAPIVSSGGTAPAISITPATDTAAGSMSAADKLKLDGLAAGVTAVGATAPITSTGGTTPTIAIVPATDSVAGSMSAADKTKLDGITGGAAVASVGATAPITSTGGTTPTIAIVPATDSVSGSMSAADKTKLDALDALLSATGVAGSGTLTVTAETVINQIASGVGVITQVSSATTTGATSANIDFAVPANTVGIVLVQIVAADATDGGAVTYSGKFIDLAGTITAIKALAAQDTWDTTAGAAAWTPPSVSIALSNVQVQVTGTIALTINWTVVFQWTSAPT
jgi:hypothetical protein